MIETNVKTNPQLPATGKELLRKLEFHQLSIPDFDKECAYWMMGDISTMLYKQDIHKPDIIANYEDNRARDPKYEVASSFWQRDDVRDYMTQSHKLRAENHANWYWLHYIKKWIPKEDLINQGKIARVIASYPKYKNGYVPKDDWRNR